MRLSSIIAPPVLPGVDREARGLGKAAAEAGQATF